MSGHVPRWSRLRLKLLGLALAAALPPLVLLLLSGGRAIERQRESTAAEAQRTAQVAAQQVAVVADDMERLLTTLAMTQTVRSGTPEQRDELFATLAGIFPQVNAIFYLDERGREQGISTHQSGTARLDAGQRVYVQEALSSGQFTISREPLVAQSTGRPVIPMVAPVRDASGRLTGLVGVGLSLGWLQDAWAALVLPPGTAVTLVQRDSGVILARSVDADRFIGLTIADDGLRRIQAIESGVYSIHHTTFGQGVDRLVGFASVPGRPWVITVAIPAEVAEAPWRRELITYALLGSGAAAAVLALALQFSHALAHPVQALAAATTALARGELAHRVRLRTGDELEELAAGFNRMAQQLEEAIREQQARIDAATAELRVALAVRDAFISIASHELRTPITTVLGYAQHLGRLLDEGRDLPPERLRQMVQSMARQSQRLRQMVDELLDVARLREGHLELRRECTDLSALVQRVVAEFQTMLDGRHVIVLLVPPEPVLGYWDAGRLEQVVTNLLENAVKYSPHGGEIRVELTRAGEQARLCVHDQGIGIAPEQLDRLFELFHRAPNAAGRPVPGLGIGLAIVREIVQRHGGQVQAHSAGEGEGATFIVELPLEDQPGGGGNIR
jgi:two-component system OmpR family sensor kinase